MKNHLIKKLSLIAFLFNFTGCSTNELPELEPGRCRLSKDCPQGQECRNTRCQDLYYPRHEIKTN